MPARLGLFGGSFNPIHFGHLITARAVAEQLRLPKIVLIPAAAPPHKDGRHLAPGPDRLAMTQLAVQGDPLFEVSDVEQHRAGPSYTFDTLGHYRALLGADAELFWLIGADSLPELVTWHRVAELVRIVQIVTMVRPGLPGPNLDGLRARIDAESMRHILDHRLATPAVEISATDIRARVASGQEIRYLTPEPVARYIREHRLFTSH